MLLTLFIWCKEKKPGLYLQQAENILPLNAQMFSRHADKKLATGKMDCLICFFVGVAIKISASVNSCRASKSL